MRNCHAAAALVLLCGATTLIAEEFTHEASGLKLTLPKGWTCTEDGEKFTIENGDKTLALVGGVIPKDSAKAIMNDVGEFLESLDGLDDVEVVSGPEKETVNNLTQSWYSGTASFTDKESGSEAEEVEWDLTIVKGGKGILFLMGLGNLDDNEKVYTRLFESIEKAEVEVEDE